VSTPTRFWPVARSVAWRAVHHFATNPAFLLPSLLFPTFFLVAFAGGLSSVGDVPGFDFPSGYTAFQFCFVLIQASAFGGIFTGFAIAADFESGFARRLMLAAPSRLSVLAGYALAALTRTLVTTLYLFVIAYVIAGMQVDGTFTDLLAMLWLALSVSLIATLFSAGIAFRMRTIQAGPAMQMPAFILIFLSPVFVPRDLLTGWIEFAASVNPFTALVEGARALISGGDFEGGLVLAVLAGMVGLLLVWAVRGLRKAEAAG
jgi:ABC-2 type transport system permease protein